RVAEFAFDRADTAGVPEAAREVRITGSPADIDSAVAVVEKTKGVSGNRTVAAFSWVDVDRWAAAAPLGQVLRRLRNAGLDAIAELPLDQIGDLGIATKSLQDAGFRQLRWTIATPPPLGRAALLIAAPALHDTHGIVQSINPLPMSLSTFRPTTGYEDVKMVALARLAAPNVPSIQVDWRRYGPKLAQVALTFGADDIDGVAPPDDAAGRREASAVAGDSA